METMINCCESLTNDDEFTLCYCCWQIVVEWKVPKGRNYGNYENFSDFVSVRRKKNQWLCEKSPVASEERNEQLYVKNKQNFTPPPPRRSKHNDPTSSQRHLRGWKSSNFMLLWKLTESKYCQK